MNKYTQYLVDDYDPLSVVDDSDEDWYDDDDDELATLVIAEMFDDTRNFKWDHCRVSWTDHVDKLIHEKMFDRTYRMSYESFCKLADMLRVKLTCDCVKSKASCAGTSGLPIFPELVMAIGLRWLAGGSYLDIKNAYRCSAASIYRCRNTFLYAVNACPELAIVFPDTPEKLDKAVAAFAKRSTDNIIRGCVGALDGFLAQINCPSMEASENNQAAYYSGHYSCHGLNVQAVCDHRSRFIFFATVAPGKSADQTAFERTSLYQLVANLPPGYYLAADAAYTLTEKCLVPFTGSQREDKNKDAFNFFLSQLRIRIEMAFGLLTNKWGILRKNLCTGMSKCAEVLEVCARLHNFVITEDGDEDEDEEETLAGIPVMPNSPLQWGYLPTVEELVVIPGTSQMRDIIVRKIRQLQLRRPAHNVARQELHELNLM
jgi:hypothetical protein